MFWKKVCSAAQVPFKCPQVHCFQESLPLQRRFRPGPNHAHFQTPMLLASPPYFLLSLCPAAKFLSVFDNCRFLSLRFILHVFSQLFLPINLLYFYHLSFTFLPFYQSSPHIQGNWQAWVKVFLWEALFQVRKKLCLFSIHTHIQTKCELCGLSFPAMPLLIILSI